MKCTIKSPPLLGRHLASNAVKPQIIEAKRGAKYPSCLADYYCCFKLWQMLQHIITHSCGHTLFHCMAILLAVMHCTEVGIVTQDHHNPYTLDRSQLCSRCHEPDSNPQGLLLIGDYNHPWWATDSLQSITPPLDDWGLVHDDTMQKPSYLLYSQYSTRQILAVSSSGEPQACCLTKVKHCACIAISCIT